MTLSPKLGKHGSRGHAILPFRMRVCRLAIPNIRYEQGLTTPKVAAQPQADRPSRVG